MRVVTSNAFDSSIHTLQKRQQALTELQQKMTSGKRVERASDDPAAAARAERALERISRAGAQQRAVDASRSAMAQGESALGDATELLQQAREMVVGAGNATYTDAERQTLAASLRGLRDDLFRVANRHDGTGRYLFGGQGSDQPPLLDTPAGVVFNGSSGQARAESGESLPLSLDGQAAWLQAPDPGNPGSTVSVFDTLDRTIAALATPGRTSAAVAQTVAEGLTGIDAVSANISSWRARAGEALNRADGIESRLSQSKLQAQTEKAGAEDLDMLSAISEFQNKQTGYSAALQTYSLVQRMSLFDYIK